MKTIFLLAVFVFLATLEIVHAEELNALFEQLDKETIEAWIRTNGENDAILELRVYQLATKKKTK